MAPVGQRKRSGGTRKGSAGSGDRALVELASGLRGLSELTGNRAMVAMLARRKGTDHDELELDNKDEAGGDQREEMLAKLRLLLDADIELDKNDPKKLLEQLKRQILMLVAVLHSALDGAEGYAGELLEEFEKLSRLDEGPEEHRAELMLKLLHALRGHGEQIHASLSGQLPRHGEEGDTPRIPLHLVTKLMDDLRKLREDIESGKPPEKEHAHADAGAGDLLDKEKLL